MPSDYARVGSSNYVCTRRTPDTIVGFRRRNKQCEAKDEMQKTPPCHNSRCVVLQALLRIGCCATPAASGMDSSVKAHERKGPRGRLLHVSFLG